MAVDKPCWTKPFEAETMGILKRFVEKSNDSHVVYVAGAVEMDVLARFQGLSQ